MQTESLRITRILGALSIGFALLLTLNATAQTSWYVATNGTGNGTSWLQATNNLQGAIDAAAAQVQGSDAGRIQRADIQRPQGECVHVLDADPF